MGGEPYGSSTHNPEQTYVAEGAAADDEEQFTAVASEIPTTRREHIEEVLLAVEQEAVYTSRGENLRICNVGCPLTSEVEVHSCESDFGPSQHSGGGGISEVGVHNSAENGVRGEESVLREREHGSGVGRQVFSTSRSLAPRLGCYPDTAHKPHEKGCLVAVCTTTFSVKVVTGKPVFLGTDEPHEATSSHRSRPCPGVA